MIRNITNIYKILSKIEINQLQKLIILFLLKNLISFILTKKEWLMVKNYSEIRMREVKIELKN